MDGGILAAGPGSPRAGDGDVSPPAGAPEPNEQLDINREALLRGSSEAIRAKAALLLLQNPSAAARRIVTEVLRTGDNDAAVSALCRSLILARSQGKAPADPNGLLVPLVSVLTREDDALAALAAEASIVFAYDLIGPALDEVLSDPKRSRSARLHAVEALWLQPDKRAVTRLLELVDDGDEAVSARAREGLHALGLPIGSSPTERQALRQQLERTSKDVFLREYVLGQEKRIQRERLEAETWRGLYLDSLDQLYATVSDDVARGSFLIKHLQAPQVQRRRWALTKAHEWRMAAGSNLPEAMNPVLLGLVADGDRLVRLDAARLLAKIGDAGAAPALLARLDDETDEPVRAALFVALGMACDVALMAGEQGKVAPEIKRKTLDIALTFLADSDPNRIREGADVIGKLLAKNGLEGLAVDRILGRLRERFLAEDMAANAGGQADLLGVMADLCLPRSTCRVKAIRLFKDLFTDVRSDPRDPVRQQAIQGLINADRTAALRALRKDYANDGYAPIRTLLMETAAEVGEAADLGWLTARLGEDRDKLLAWKAITAIAGRLDAQPLSVWLKGRLERESSLLTPDQAVSLLRILDRKAAAEKQAALRAWTLECLAEHQQAQGDTEAAVKTLEGLVQAQAGEVSDTVAERLATLYLQGGQVPQLIALLDRRLARADLAESDPLAAVIDAFGGPGAAPERRAIAARLAREVKAPDGRPNWDRLCARWLQREATPTPADG